MLDTLSSRLSRILKTMRGQARLTEENTRDMVREIRLALLEADVALPVVRDLIARIKAKAMGEEVIGNLNPGQALVGVVERELTSVIGGDLPPEERTIRLNVQPPAVILLAGLQGAGKTTTAGKLAKWLKETQNKKVLTFSADVYRPAAIDQLKTVTEQAGCDFFPSTPEQKPLDIARDAMDWARRHFYDVVIADTAGRLAIDEQMMQEVSDLSAYLKPAETLFVIDAMLGQDAVNTAKAFNERLTLTGIILTKVDGDSRGGAALSVRMVTGKPIKFVGVGEKLTGFEPFNPEQMAGRILGMGDIVALVKDVQKSVDIEQAQKLAQKIKTGERFDLNDFKAQISQMKSIGVSGLIDKLPAQFQEAAAKVKDKDVNKTIGRTEGIINSMTPKERRNPDLIKASRKRRIAAGAGVSVQEVNKLLKQFEQTREMMKRMQKGGLAKMMRALGNFGGFGGGFPGFKR
ncbi:MAG: signal recognition particle protein [Sutterella sp.]|uniref:signal recognition particle protein n=1 Tax=Duodenibacillus massiliensis TaxID=1852381 RepID=UPI000939AA99|nr:signal recognition particle protein [Duodenibacillus massiliensis]MBE5701430.1 signal recognition particle protein [Sutterella sp.]MBS1385433.1 signal recognition particle protein [Duodenibacillus sp.]MBS5791483.1 signal recognition particle protein [Sutterella sp.]HAF65921.1 signal recognition particle protein [Sutterella sp.]